MGDFLLLLRKFLKLKFLLKNLLFRMFSTIRVFERELRCNLKGVSSLKRLMSSQTINVRNEDMTVGNAKADGSEEEPIWRNPEKHAIPQQSR